MCQNVEKLVLPTYNDLLALALKNISATIIITFNFTLFLLIYTEAVKSDLNFKLSQDQCIHLFFLV